MARTELTIEASVFERQNPGLRTRRGRLPTTSVDAVDHVGQRTRQALQLDPVAVVCASGRGIPATLLATTKASGSVCCQQSVKINCFLDCLEGIFSMPQIRQTK